MANVQAKPVQVYMREPTLRKIDEMKETLHNPNRSEIVKTSIDIAEMITKVMDEGGEVFVKKADGSQAKLFIPGVGK